MEFILMRDGVEVMRGSEEKIMAYIHRSHPYSVYHALTYEGYQVEAIA